MDEFFQIGKRRVFHPSRQIAIGGAGDETVLGKVCHQDAFQLLLAWFSRFVESLVRASFQVARCFRPKRLGSTEVDSVEANGLRADFLFIRHVACFYLSGEESEFAQFHMIALADVVGCRVQQFRQCSGEFAFADSCMMRRLLYQLLGSDGAAVDDTDIEFILSVVFGNALFLLKS